MDALWHALDTAFGLEAAEAADLSALQVAGRAAVVYLVLIGFIRIGKKRFLGQATAFDMILVIVIGSVASRAISGTAPFIASLAGALALILMHWLLSYLTRWSPALSGLVKGNVTPLVRNGMIDRRALKAAHMSDDDLDEDLRLRGIDDVMKVKDARLERSGKLSVVAK